MYERGAPTDDQPKYICNPENLNDSQLLMGNKQPEPIDSPLELC